MNIEHPTYHHFTGSGRYDSNIDIILHSESHQTTETIVNILCKFDLPEVTSHHDLIFSLASIPPELSTKSINEATLISAPRTIMARVRITWSEEGIGHFHDLASQQLLSLRDSWLNPSSKASTSVLLQATSDILTLCAKKSNKFVILNQMKECRKKKPPASVTRASRRLARTHRNLKASNVASNVNKKKAFETARRSYRKTVRSTRLRQSIAKDKKVDSILSSNPTKFYSFLKSTRKTKANTIEYLNVSDKVYRGAAVADGFYDSMTSLKTCDLESLSKDPHLSEHFSNYQHILKLCQDKLNIPVIGGYIGGSTKMLITTFLPFQSTSTTDFLEKININKDF